MLHDVSTQDSSHTLRGALALLALREKGRVAMMTQPAPSADHF